MGKELGKTTWLPVIQRTSTRTLVDEFGSINDVNSESVKTMGLFEKGLGISTTTSFKLMKSMKGVSGLTIGASIIRFD